MSQKNFISMNISDDNSQVSSKNSEDNLPHKNFASQELYLNEYQWWAQPSFKLNSEDDLHHKNSISMNINDEKSQVSSKIYEDDLSHENFISMNISDENSQDSCKNSEDDLPHKNSISIKKGKKRAPP